MPASSERPPPLTHPIAHSVGGQPPTVVDFARSTPHYTTLRRELPRLGVMTPAALLLVLFFIFPAGWAIYTSLTDLALLGLGAQQTDFVGLDNYRRLWNDPDLQKIIRNTAVFVIGSAVIGQTGLGLILALLLNHAQHQKTRLVPLAYAAVLVAWVSPPAFVGAIWGDILNARTGVLNSALASLGLGLVDMLGDHPMLSVIMADVWRGTAFAMVIFLGALQTISSQIYEAARVDGANALQRFRDHTLPIVAHLAAIVLMTTTITTMGAFMLILLLNNGGNAYATETMALYAFHRAFGQYEIGFGAAISVVMLGLNLLFATVYLRIARVSE